MSVSVNNGAKALAIVCTEDQLQAGGNLQELVSKWMRMDNEKRAHKDGLL